ncbi:MAG: Asp23/Gls24 family envelope stress response protein [Anaerolineales bacterium]
MAKSKTKKAETAEKEDEPRAPGKTTIAPNVLVRIAQLTSLSVPGVASMALIPSGVNRLFRREAGDGVRIELDNESVAADLYLALDYGVEVRKVSRKVQREVARALEDMVGMMVTRVDVHIEEISFEHEA